MNNSTVANAKINNIDEVGMEERIKSGEELEITEAVEILFMIKDKVPFDEISKKTGKPISDINKVKDIFEL